MTILNNIYNRFMNIFCDYYNWDKVIADLEEQISDNENERRFLEQALQEARLNKMRENRGANHG